MLFTECALTGAYVIEMEKREDHRGFFARSWCAREMQDHGLSTNVCQANMSFSKSRGTLRGMHFQHNPHQEAKLVRCTHGAIFDVIIDLRPQSRTFGQWLSVELSADNAKMLYVPEDFAHGFLTLEDHCEVNYLVTQFYRPDAEGGIRWNDPAFGIDWPFEPKVLSERDANHSDYKVR